MTCAACGTELPAALLACPRCGRLVHADRLNELAASARAAADRDDPTATLEAWREALELLPAGSRQHEAILAKISELSRIVDAPGRARPAQRDVHAHALHKTGVGKALAGAGVIALLLWKFKFVLGFVLTKGKLLLLGLTKWSTLFSMILSMGAYWTVWGWRFALGLVLSIYVHEMGHVVALRRFGFRVTAPLFIPGVGAVIRLQQHPANAREDARIGLAGPIYGLGAALACCGLWLLTGHGSFAAIARVGAWINLFNLLPVYPLDGGRGFRSMSRRQRWIAAAALATAWYFSEEGLLALLLVVAALRALAERGDEEGDPAAIVQYIGLVAAFSALTLLPVPIDE